jgi:hypothetical protein
MPTGRKIVINRTVPGPRPWASAKERTHNASHCHRYFVLPFDGVLPGFLSVR